MEEAVRKIAEADVEAVRVLEAYSAIEQVYVGTLRAMGVLPEVRQSVSSSAEVRVSFSPHDRVS